MVNDVYVLDRLCGCTHGHRILRCVTRLWLCPECLKLENLGTDNLLQNTPKALREKRQLSFLKARPYKFNVKESNNGATNKADSKSSIVMSISNEEALTTGPMTKKCVNIKTANFQPVMNPKLCHFLAVFSLAPYCHLGFTDA